MSYFRLSARLYFYLADNLEESTSTFYAELKKLKTEQLVIEILLLSMATDVPAE